MSWKDNLEYLRDHEPEVEKTYKTLGFLGAGSILIIPLVLIGGSTFPSSGDSSPDPCMLGPGVLEPLMAVQVVIGTFFLISAIWIKRRSPFGIKMGKIAVIAVGSTYLWVAVPMFIHILMSNALSLVLAN